MKLLERMRSRRMVGRSFGALLFALLAIELLGPVLAEFDLENSVLPRIVFLLVLVTSLSAAVERPRPLVILTFLALVSEVLTWTPLDEVVGSSAATTIRLLCRMAFFGLTAWIIMRHVVRGERVTADKVTGAACVYFLLGMTFSQGYGLLVHFRPESLVYPEHLVEGTSLLLASNMDALNYFSFTTLTTLGYGDVVPVSPLARSIASIEAIVGQLFVAIVIARLVGLEIAYRMGPQGAPSSPTGSMEESTASSAS